MAGFDTAVLHAQLERWAGEHYHEGTVVRDLRPMPGHAGLSFGFTVVDATGVLDRLVTRMPPKGVRRAGNTDVLRQVPLLQALRAAGVPVAEVAFWSPLLAKAAEPEWAALGERTRDLLLASLPVDPHVGVFHGDFQTNNVLFDGASVVALLDWEISGIGAQLLDLGWLLFMNDVDSWADAAGLATFPPFDEVIGWYADAIGRPVTLDDVAFYRALSGYRFGVISGLNVMLHRTGKRHDPEWERIALSVPSMFGRACDLLA